MTQHTETHISTGSSVLPAKQESLAPPLRMKTLMVFFLLLFGLNMLRVWIVMPWEQHLNTVLASIIDLVDKAGIWIGLTYLFVAFVEKRPFLTAVQLKGQLVRGLLVGLIGSLIPVLLLVLQVVLSHRTLHVMVTIDTFFGALPIVLAGLIEEIPFRGFLFKHFQHRMSLSTAMFLNAALFLCIHIPMWLSTGMKINDMIHTGIEIFLLALLLCVAVHLSKSLWSSIVIHTVNNILSLF